MNFVLDIFLQNFQPLVSNFVEKFNLASFVMFERERERENDFWLLENQKQKQRLKKFRRGCIFHSQPEKEGFNMWNEKGSIL